MTKRRKVWVMFEDGEPSWVASSAEECASMHLSGEESGKPFVQVRRGDVILSREQLVTAFVAYGYQPTTAKKLAAFLAKAGGK